MSHKIHKHQHITHHHHHEGGFHKEIFDDFDENNLPEPKPPLVKRIVIVLMSLFLVSLLLSYFLIGPHTLDIVESMIASEKIKELSIEGDDFAIIFEPEAFENLTAVYLDNKEHEFKACLLGTIEGNTYSVDTVLIPTIYQQSYANVRSAGCPKEAIITMHSHPFKRCIASNQDFVSFEAFRTLNPDAVLMVMCELDRFYVYK